MHNDYSVLPDKLYLVSVPVVATYTEEEIALFGVPLDYTPGTKKGSTDYLSDMTKSMMNIDRMIDTYMNGFPISVVNNEDVAEIYTILEKYLHIHVNKIQHSVNSRLNNEERLKEIDNFLTEIFDYNRVSITKELFTTNQGGYGIGINAMNMDGTYGQPGAIPDTTFKLGGRTTSISEAYRTPAEPTTNNTTYIQPNLPNIDINSVKREKQVKMVRPIKVSNLK